ncbi:MAG: thiamine phosphate synthase [Deltaproteobacteria bacterium]|nr:thiamine phosphate synthase [Deltaproteobacteria bacterium]
MRAAVDFRLYLITDRRLASGGDLLSAVERALSGGVRAVQLREKDLGGRELLELARKMRALTSRHGARLLINDRVDIALAAGADGVHLGGSSIPPQEARRLLGPGKLIGCSTHGAEQLEAAEAGGADFAVFGPVYFTPSKASYGPPLGVDALRRVCASARIPVFALGGIGSRNINEVVAAGADGIAMISAILASEDPETAASEINHSVNNAISRHREGQEEWS